ncbi:coenzyme F420-reducing hydrogenase beta subunit [Marinobacterium halophilum]|uniref:Coenzyme F420-reducing hydrogenase beta subunit n=1 Tax=Marinobacterium halophilum TaxID=267374 RepID=A0A2P8F258_9GAMM|nr:Coenzyme F420 hydrogenase/dehydrogenase, beta subunit C-terminal domain [Marinobacterium halophilum]PSL15794.1 coenzyme F420-reducing hydrogenase beta subunit [Marinobacterium halophilum]
MKKHVVNEIVANDICSGCGVCAGVCPSKILDMNVQANGDLAPDITAECPPRCVLCLDVCPFSSNSISITQLTDEKFTDPEVKQHEAVGKYTDNIVGYSPTHRSTGASGGMLSWLLEAMLRENLVDAVITVSSSSDNRPSDGLLFQMTEFTCAEQVRAASGSFYYPISAGARLRSIQDLKEGKRYAVVGLPCTLKGIALAMRKLPVLRRSIAYTFGLVCGHLPNVFYTEYLSKVSGCEPDNIGSVSYRGENPGRPANNYLFRAVDKSGKSGRPVPFYGAISNAWVSRQFQLNACNFCDDLFAEVADASFMDAWLPEYMADHRGHSIVTVRNPEIMTVFERGRKGNSCSFEPIDIDKVADSQASQWEGKSSRLQVQMALAVKQGKKIPPLRQVPKLGCNYIAVLKICLQNKLQHLSKNRWAMQRSEPLENYDAGTKRYVFSLKVISSIERMIRVVKNPSKVYKKIAGRF